MLMSSPNYDAGPSHTAASSSHAGPYQTGPSYSTYRVPSIPYSYPIVHEGMVVTREIPLNPMPCQQFFPLPEGMQDHETALFHTQEIQDAYMVASSWTAFGTDQATQLEEIRQAFGGMLVGGSRSRTRTKSQSVYRGARPPRGGQTPEESQGSKMTRQDG